MYAYIHRKKYSFQTYKQKSQLIYNDINRAVHSEFIKMYDNTLYDHGKVSRKQALEYTDVRLLVKAILLEWKA